MPMDFFLNEYKNSLSVQWLTPDTIQFYEAYIKRFIKYSDIQSPLDFNSVLKVKMAYNCLPNRNISKNTIDKFYKSIKKYCLFLEEMEIIDSKVYNKLSKVRKDKKIPEYLSDEQVNDIRESIYQTRYTNTWERYFWYRNIMIFDTLLYTWVRRKELTELLKENVKNNHIKVVWGKWGRDRIVYIPSQFSNLIRDYIAMFPNGEYVFTTMEWKKLTSRALSDVFQRIRYRSWFKVSPHLLRHTYATRCVQAWINIYTLQQQLGHSKLETTSIYLSSNNGFNAKEMEKLK